MRIPLLCLALIAALALSQSIPAQTATQPAPPAPRPKKVLTPGQVAYQAALKTYQAQADKLRAAAVAAFNAELAREKAPTCPNAVSTVDINECLAHENDLTDANLKAFTTNLRAMLALPAPKFPGETPYIGPSGPEATPATNTAAFDKAQAAWATYAEAECSAVDTYWRSGTIVNAMVGECGLRMARARMHELDSIYNVVHPM
jgi:uncharacterized protein YecT (DUF1311 family)